MIALGEVLNPRRLQSPRLCSTSLVPPQPGLRLLPSLWPPGFTLPQPRPSLSPPPQAQVHGVLCTRDLSKIAAANILPNHVPVAAPVDGPASRESLPNLRRSAGAPGSGSYCQAPPAPPAAPCDLRSLRALADSSTLSSSSSNIQEDTPW